jgi:hypothetical protein
VAAPALASAFYMLLLLPPEFSVSLGTMRLSGYRVLLLAVTPLLLSRLFSGRGSTATVVDCLVLAHAAWVVLALVVHAGPVDGIESGGIYFVECVGAYLVGRMAITNADEHRAILKFMITVLLAMLVFTLPEALTGKHLIRDVARAVMGGPGLVPIDPRMGLDRAYGSFDHPILYGVFAGSTFAAGWYVLGEERLKLRNIGLLCAIGFSCFLSLSAGPFVGLGCQFGVLGWDRLTRGIDFRWSALLAMAALFFLALSLASNRSPIKVLISYLSFSPVSSYNRILIFEYGTAEVGRHPLLGIGFGDWIRAPWMSDSMDNFWLLTAVRYGLPALIFLVGAILALGFAQVRGVGRDARLERHRMAWVAIVVGLVVAGTTVHFWNALFAYFFFLVGSGAWLTKPPRPQGMRWVLLEPARIPQSLVAS